MAPCRSLIGVIVSADPSRVTVAEGSSVVDSETTRLSVTSPSISLAFTEIFKILLLLTTTLSIGSIDGGCPRRLVSAEAALILPPVSVLPLRLCSGSTVFRIALVTSVTDIPGLAALRRPTTPATWGAAIEVPLKEPYEFPGSVE